MIITVIIIITIIIITIKHVAYILKYNYLFWLITVVPFKIDLKWDDGD